MMSGHGTNPIFFNKKKTSDGQITLANTPTTLGPITFYFYLRLSHFYLMPFSLMPSSVNN